MALDDGITASATRYASVRVSLSLSLSLATGQRKSTKTDAVFVGDELRCLGCGEELRTIKGPRDQHSRTETRHPRAGQFLENTSLRKEVRLARNANRFPRLHSLTSRKDRKRSGRRRWSSGLSMMRSGDLQLIKTWDRGKIEPGFENSLSSPSGSYLIHQNFADSGGEPRRTARTAPDARVLVLHHMAGKGSRWAGN